MIEYMTIFVSNVYKFEYNAESDDDDDEDEDNGDNVGDDNGVTTR